MAERFVEVDRNTPMLLPADLRDWVPEDDLVHFVIEAVKSLPISEFVVNERGSGQTQYPPLDGVGSADLLLRQWDSLQPADRASDLPGFGPKPQAHRPAFRPGLGVGAGTEALPGGNYQRRRDPAQSQCQ